MKQTLRRIPQYIINILEETKGGPFQNCLNCLHWSKEKDLCDKYKVKPPTEIIVYSCPEYEDINEIPF